MTLWEWAVIIGLFLLVAIGLVWHEYRLDLLLTEIDRLDYRTKAIDHRSHVERHK